MATQVLGAPPAKEAKPGRKLLFARYLLCLVLGVAGGCALTWLLVGSRWYIAHSQNPGLWLVGYSQWMGRQDCQILLYGDSSALTGLDPAWIAARTGLKTCNIAEGTTIQGVSGSDAPLQAYLRRNAPPRYLLGMWTPSRFRPDQPAYQSYFFEGFVYAIHYMGLFRTLSSFVRHPNWFVHLGSDSFNSLWDSLWDLQVNHHHTDARAERIARSGQWMFARTPETHCVLGRSSLAFAQRWPQSAATFRRKYASAHTTLFLDVAPSPSCDALFSVYAQNNAGLYDNTFEKVPIRFFNEGDVHFSAEGSQYVSEKAAQQILASEKLNRPRAPSSPVK